MPTSFLSRILGRAESVTSPASGDRPFALAPRPAPTPRPAPAPTVVASTLATCPYCAMPLVPTPIRSRACPHCRKPMAVRRLGGRIVLLAEDAVDIFDAQQQKERDEARWTTESRRWLALAAMIGASEVRRARLAAAPPSAGIVDECRSLYLTTADAAVRTARREKRWTAVSRIGRAQAANLYEVAGRPVPPPPDVLELHRSALLAELRGLKARSKMAELVGSGCCAACRRDEGRSFPIAAELKTPRLPHDGCPKGLCACDWWIATAPPVKPRRRRRQPDG